VSDDTQRKILEAAADVFAERGYRASLDEIVRRAGVAKQTVYHYFPSKDKLFARAAEMMGEGILVTLAPHEAETLADTLRRFACALRERILAEPCIALHRLLVAEAPRFPDLARTIYEAGLGETIRHLAALLARAMKAGQLRHDDPLFAAELLVGMLTSAERTRRLYEAQRPDDMQPETADRIVSLFLHAYRAEEPIKSTDSPSPPRSTTP
jgi:AcrR family transcriptional regulator